MGKKFDIGAVSTLGIAKNSKTMNQIADPLGLFAGPEEIKSKVADKKYFDVTNEAKAAGDAYAPLLANSQAMQQAASPYSAAVIAQMGKAASGQGPSLAEVQLKAAQDRNLAQQLAAAQSMRGGSAGLQSRNMMQSMGQAGRGLAQDSAVARLQERNEFLQAASGANQNLRTDITGKLNLDIMPKQAMQQWELARVGAANSDAAANMAAQNAQKGAILGAVGSIGGMFMGGPMGAAAGGSIGKSFGGGGGSMAANSGGGMMSTGQMNQYSFAEGGPVKGPGTGTSDSIHAKLSDGEFVVTAAAARTPGIVEALQKLNKNPKKYAPELVKILGKKSEKKA